MAIIVDVIKIENMLNDLTLAWHLPHQFSKPMEGWPSEHCDRSLLKYRSGLQGYTLLLR